MWSDDFDGAGASFSGAREGVDFDVLMVLPSRPIFLVGTEEDGAGLGHSGVSFFFSF